MFAEIIKFVIGALLLWKGADIFVRGASVLAARAGVSGLMAGLTLGALGTSLPEMVVSWFAAVSGTPSIALGNAMGSNVANICLALGLGAVIAPVEAARREIMAEYGVMVFAAALLWALSFGLYISRVSGSVLLLCGVLYLFLLSRRRKTAPAAPVSEGKNRSLPAAAAGTLLALGALLLGADFMVGSVVSAARATGLSQTLISLSAVALGTSLPEIAVLVAGSIRKEYGIGIGTVIGSNIFNIFFVAGGAAAISGISIESAEFIFQIPAVFAVSVLLFPFLFTGLRVARAEGAALLGLYMGYMYLIFRFIR